MNMFWATDGFETMFITIFHQEKLHWETAHNLHVDTVSDDAEPLDQHVSYS